MKRVAIIGTAGRTPELLARLNARSMDFMADRAVRAIKSFGISEVTLVSGGSAWADHVAVQMYLRGTAQALVIYAPCGFKDKRFDDSTSCGRALNKYHKDMGFDSLSEIAAAVDKGAEIRFDARGFYARNTEVARSDYLIAFGFSDSGAPDTPGTLDTWRKCRGTRVYFRLP